MAKKTTKDKTQEVVATSSKRWSQIATGSKNLSQIVITLKTENR